MLLQLRAGNAKGSRTHYLAGWGGHFGNRQELWLVKNKVGLSAYGAGGVEVNGFPNWQFGIQ
jgi:hypothetical protein